MPPLAADGRDFLILDFIAGNSRIPHAVFDSLLACLSSPSAALPRTSQSQLLRKTLVLRALDAAVHTEDNEESDEPRAAAAVADLKRLLDLEWANLPPSALELELSANRIAGDGAHQTWAAADHTKRIRRRLLVGNSMDREILAKLVQDGSASPQPNLTEVVDNARSETDDAQRDDEALQRR